MKIKVCIAERVYRVMCTELFEVAILSLLVTRVLALWHPIEKPQKIRSRLGGRPDLSYLL